MKIIAVGMNYAQHNRELGHTQENRGTCYLHETRLGYFERRQAVFCSRLLPMKSITKRKLWYVFAG